MIQVTKFKICRNNLILGLICLFLTISCSFKTQTVTFTDGAGKQYKIFVPRKIGRNTHTSYYPNGSIEFEASYFNGKPDGVVKYWLQSGQLISVAQYENGKLHGSWYRYHENGKLAYSGDYFFGDIHGNEKFYHQNGNIKSSQEFQFGVQVSELIRFNSNGELIYQP